MTEHKRRIYLASSWRNPNQPAAVKMLREAGHEVYDFRNPPDGSPGFDWAPIDENWLSWPPERFVQELENPVTLSGFRPDKYGLDWCDTCILLLPCGRSAHLEAGYAIGRGRPTLIVLDEEKFEPELMYLLADKVVPSLDDMLPDLAELRQDRVLPAGMRRLATAALNASRTWDDDISRFAMMCTDENLSQEERNQRVSRIFDFLSVVKPADIVKLLELRPEMAREINQITCIHCSLSLARNEIKDHIMACEQNPVVIENLRLKEELAAADYLDAEASIGAKELMAENERLKKELAALGPVAGDPPNATGDC